MVKECSLCSKTQEDKYFELNKLDFINICDSCVNTSPDLFNNIFTEDNNFDEYWSKHSKSLEYYDNVFNILIELIEYFFKKIKMIDIINYLLLITDDNVILKMTNNLTINIVKYSIENSMSSISNTEPLSHNVSEVTFESWKNFFKSFSSVFKNTDSKILKEILDQAAVKEILSTVIIKAFDYIIESNLGSIAGKLTRFPIKQIVNLFLGDASSLIVDFLKKEENDQMIKDFMSHLFETLFEKESDNNNTADTEELYNTLSIAIVNTSQDKKIHNNTINKIKNLLFTMSKDKNYNISIDTYLYINYSDYNFIKLKEKIELYCKTKLDYEFISELFIKNFIKKEIKSYLEFKSNNK